ncbi:inositol-3-phosphate synthase [Teladorsagia circumcincta]|uniref:Inositol-3-phosphate synthase n=1 Tax=Teladorsagia circumcincta TaxID=45464 RepID=A0A2G9U7Z4_TELCI|nr:inositol-3-phosphate synthase [Teladorsagia circumcincta]
MIDLDKIKYSDTWIQQKGVLLVGIGGNNGSTSVGAIMANKKHMTWRTKEGIQTANYFGSVTQSSTVHLGWDGQQQIHVPFKEIIPILSPNDLIIDGWDINNQNLYQAMIRAKVFEPELQEKLRPYMEPIVPMPSIYYPDFIAANQGDRANNIIPGNNKRDHLEHIRRDIRDFKAKHDLECVIVLWTANTERYTDVVDGLNMTAEQILASVDASADEHNVFVGGDDFKSGQTKIKSALVDFLVSSGLKPESIVSYNHLGNNDGKNLSEARQFRSKEISKSSVVDDMVEANKILYPTGQKPDHCIVIKYVPFVGDSKRAMDEYICSIFMGGRQTFVIHNTCEDSLLATPLIYDLAILTELATRIRYADATKGEFCQFHEVLSILSLLLKAPVVPPGTPVGNAFMRQFASLTKLITTLAGIASDTDMQIEFFTQLPKAN